MAGKILYKSLRFFLVNFISCWSDMVFRFFIYLFISCLLLCRKSQIFQRFCGLLVFSQVITVVQSQHRNREVWRTAVRDTGSIPCGEEFSDRLWPELTTQHSEKFGQLLCCSGSPGPESQQPLGIRCADHSSSLIRLNDQLRLFPLYVVAQTPSWE